MPGIILTEDGKHELIPLKVKPHLHKSAPTITTSLFSQQAGTVLYGHYVMEYLLPQGDKLRLIANHNKKTVQLKLFTHDAELIKHLPGERQSSLVADIISRLEQYRLRNAHYLHPLSQQQEQKLALCELNIALLQTLLEKERAIAHDNHYAQEALRTEVVNIIERCRDKNRLIANNPVVSEGSFGLILYDAFKTAREYHFNRVFEISQNDQMDFSHAQAANNNQAPCFIWDSEEHIGYNSNDLDNAIRIICQQYQLNPAEALIDIPANRFKKLEQFSKKLWYDLQGWIEYLASTKKPEYEKHEPVRKSDGITITTIEPYYKLHGLAQKPYESAQELMATLLKNSQEPVLVDTLKQATRRLAALSDASWALIESENTILFRLENKLYCLKYFVHENHYYPMPEGDDLYTLSQISKRHLYLPERIELGFKAFLSRVPAFFKNFYSSLVNFIMHDLHEDFVTHVHAGHEDRNNVVVEEVEMEEQNHAEKKPINLYAILEKNGLLANGQTLEEFIREQLNNSPYVVARANHPPSPHPYDNPAHRLLHVFRHFSAYFVDANERNPITGTIATAAYFYGAGAILAPNLLEAFLLKLQLKGLIAGIRPTQIMAEAMCTGDISQAVSAAITYWQGIIVAGSLDEFFADAIIALKDDPAEIAIIISLALGLGYGLTKAIPVLQEEMGTFPLPNYAALGGKGGAAIYDTIMHPGDDWLLGTCKWVAHNILTLGKIVVGPFFEWGHYGFSNGFLNGLGKSFSLTISWIKQIIAASLDFTLGVLTVPLNEIGTMLVHVPFRGISNFLAKTFATIGNISAIGDSLVFFANEQSKKNYINKFKFSLLYGFRPPVPAKDNKWHNKVMIFSYNLLILFPLEIVKNFVLLPVMDTLSLVGRVLLTIGNMCIWPPFYAFGYALSGFGYYWDNSFGLFFTASAKTITKCANKIDQGFGLMKQFILSKVQIARATMYDWAFTEEDLRIHAPVTDIHYFQAEPMRIEKLPHTQDSHCLLRNLLNDNKKYTIEDFGTEPVQQQLFHDKTNEIELTSTQDFAISAN